MPIGVATFEEAVHGRARGGRSAGAGRGARRLGLEVVAEGVEDIETYRELAAMGCDAVQGFGLSRPVPAGAVPDTVRALDQRLSHERGARRPVR